MLTVHKLLKPSLEATAPALGYLPASLSEAPEKTPRGTVSVSLDAGANISSGLELANPQELPPDEFFDWQWVLAALDRAFTALARKGEAAGIRRISRGSSHASQVKRPTAIKLPRAVRRGLAKAR